ncbi:hypothetical protein GPECTOR_7g1199 [Gonium pectorale]|uniref:EF-hand domain-containing protein n=1 Tax=Gonium pectorale TaxID=33097 RepID=A0A150GTW6_GONPE|nr:hypothetical protein GPECTOR_7g1199 [Gonium pectorale]|eukprot:KXZ53305.1 hypothetical protein GPECTOR_7g1199 [Gonium pectorale]
MEVIKLFDFDNDGEINWREFHHFLSYEVMADKNPLGAEYVLPSGMALPISSMISAIRRRKLLEEVQQGGESREHWVSEGPEFLRHLLESEQYEIQKQGSRANREVLQRILSYKAPPSKQVDPEAMAHHNRRVERLRRALLGSSSTAHSVGSAARSSTSNVSRARSGAGAGGDSSDSGGGGDSSGGEGGDAGSRSRHSTGRSAARHSPGGLRRSGDGALPSVHGTPAGYGSHKDGQPSGAEFRGRSSSSGSGGGGGFGGSLQRRSFDGPGPKRHPPSPLRGGPADKARAGPWRKARLSSPGNGTVSNAAVERRARGGGAADEDAQRAERAKMRAAAAFALLEAALDAEEDMERERQQAQEQGPEQGQQDAGELPQGVAVSDAGQEDDGTFLTGLPYRGPHALGPEMGAMSTPSVPQLQSRPPFTPPQSKDGRASGASGGKALAAAEALTAIEAAAHFINEIEYVDALLEQHHLKTGAPRPRPSGGVRGMTPRCPVVMPISSSLAGDVVQASPRLSPRATRLSIGGGGTAAAGPRLSDGGGGGGVVSGAPVPVPPAVAAAAARLAQVEGVPSLSGERRSPRDGRSGPGDVVSNSGGMRVVAGGGAEITLSGGAQGGGAIGSLTPRSPSPRLARGGEAKGPAVTAADATAAAAAVTAAVMAEVAADAAAAEARRQVTQLIGSGGSGEAAVAVELMVAELAAGGTAAPEPDDRELAEGDEEQDLWEVGLAAPKPVAPPAASASAVPGLELGKGPASAAPDQSALPSATAAAAAVPRLSLRLVQRSASSGPGPYSAQLVQSARTMRQAAVQAHHGCLSARTAGEAEGWPGDAAWRAAAVHGGASARGVSMLLRAQSPSPKPQPQLRSQSPQPRHTNGRVEAVATAADIRRAAWGFKSIYPAGLHSADPYPQPPGSPLPWTASAVPASPSAQASHTGMVPSANSGGLRPTCSRAPTHTSAPPSRAGTPSTGTGAPTGRFAGLTGPSPDPRHAPPQRAGTPSSVASSGPPSQAPSASHLVAPGGFGMSLRVLETQHHPQPHPNPHQQAAWPASAGVGPAAARQPQLPSWGAAPGSPQSPTGSGNAAMVTVANGGQVIAAAPPRRSFELDSRAAAWRAMTPGPGDVRPASVLSGSVRDDGRGAPDSGCGGCGARGRPMRTCLASSLRNSTTSSASTSCGAAAGIGGWSASFARGQRRGSSTGQGPLAATATPVHATAAAAAAAATASGVSFAADAVPGTGGGGAAAAPRAARSPKPRAAATRAAGPVLGGAAKAKPEPASQRGTESGGVKHSRSLRHQASSAVSKAGSINAVFFEPSMSFSSGAWPWPWDGDLSVGPAAAGAAAVSRPESVATEHYDMGGARRPAQPRSSMKLPY